VLQRLRTKESQILNTHLFAHAWLTYLKRVCEKVQLKEFYLVKQGLCELESEERGFNPKDPETVLYSLVVGSSAALGLPLADSFFNPSFSLLLDLISSNMP